MNRRSAHGALWALSLSALACSACTCEGGVVTPTPAAIEVNPRILDLGQAPIGVQRRGTITIKNTGTGRLDLNNISLEQGLFFIEGEPADPFIAANASDVVILTGRPTELGLMSDTLTIESDDEIEPVVTVTVRLLGVEGPPCDDGNACTIDRFDTESEACVHEFDDGAPCTAADRCIIDAVCQQGVCLGQRKTCDDSNACTKDLCRQIDGECVFFEEENACDDDNPCTADSCDALGCQHEPVANGTPCDDGDLCTSGDACFTGACEGTPEGDGGTCDDGNSCTINDVCAAGVCTGESIIEPIAEGEVVFDHPLTPWPSGAFLHRREVSLADTGVFVGLDHLRLVDPDTGMRTGLTHVAFTIEGCGESPYEFAYRPPDALVSVTAVRREMQLQPDGTLRIVVGVRQLPDNGFAPQTTSYLLDPSGAVLESRIRADGGETGRSLLPDGSHIYGVVTSIDTGPPISGAYRTNLSVVRETINRQVLWRHDRSFDWPFWWGEFLGVAGPRVLFWADGRFGALDFNTGSQVWARESQYIAKEMALSTQLNLGLARVGQLIPNGQILGVEIIEGTEVFLYPPVEDQTYYPRTDPVISADGRIFVMMERGEISPNFGYVPTQLEWVELSPTGQLVQSTVLPGYMFPDDPRDARHEDFSDDPYPTIADDGVAYVGYGDHFWAIDSDGSIRWTRTSSIPNAYTGTVPLLRDDGVVLFSEGSRRVIGIRTNGGQMVDGGWASFRHDNRRTNFTP